MWCCRGPVWRLETVPENVRRGGFTIGARSRVREVLCGEIGE